MKRILSVLATAVMCLILFTVSTAGADLYGLAIQRLATRTGPGTNYEEGGTYYVEGEYIRVISRAYDKANGIWWVKCAIPYHGETRILWTGYKRFDSSQLPLESIPIEGESSSSSSGYSGGDWQGAYRQFIVSGQYDGYLSNPNGEYSSMLRSRDRQWDRFALYDFDRNGIPELIVLSVYGIEQADVFTYAGGSVAWAGRMGGDNFFQWFIDYPEYPQAGLIALTGGPAMEINGYTLSGGQLVRRNIGMTRVDSEGMDTVGINMYIDDSRLFSLLYASLVSYNGSERYMEDWAGADELYLLFP